MEAATPLDYRPRSALECKRRDGRIDFMKFFEHEARRRDEASALVASLSADDGAPPPKRRRVSLSSFKYQRVDTGELVILHHTKSVWYQNYVEMRPFTALGLNKFRRRFRLPYDEYLEFVADARRENWFPNVGKPDATGKLGAPLELLILGAFRYLGRGWSFDDIEESTNISAERHRVFFHEFIDIGSTKLFAKHVVMPTTREAAEDAMYEFEKAGFHGAVGSGDATHVTTEKCSARLQNNHSGFKSKTPTLAFNMTVNHRRLILWTSCGMPGCWNDKTLQLHDDFFVGIDDGSVLGVSAARVLHFHMHS